MCFSFKDLVSVLKQAKCGSETELHGYLFSVSKQAKTDSETELGGYREWAFLCISVSSVGYFRNHLFTIYF